jgi:DNA-3-methyladenine glycosylase I
MSKKRCDWPGADPLYLAYHDEEWGVPERDGQALFAKLLLDGFQAGLSWITILRRREGFQAVFENFDPRRLAKWGPRQIETALLDERIIRSRAKVESAVGNARAYLAMTEKGEDFSTFIWSATKGKTIINRWTGREQVPAETAESRDLSKALKARGFKFCGPVIVYAFMQACGLVNDHYVDCFRHRECGKKRD